MTRETIARYAIIGDPVAHSLSPRMQQAAFEACAIRATYEAIAVRRHEMRDAVARLRADDFAGFNVTTPLKELVMASLDECTAEAKQARSVNTVRREDDGRYTGHETDGAGLIGAVRELWQFDPKDKRIALLGSGPAARAMDRALRAANVAQLWCWSRNTSAASALGPPPSGVADLVISALPADAVVPESVLGCVGPDTLLFDLNYGARSPLESAHGAAFSDGLPMLLHQGALAFEWWTNGTAPIEVMRTALGISPAHRTR